MTARRHHGPQSPPRGLPLSTYVLLGLLILVSAFLMAVALVSPNYPWLSFTTLIPLFVAIRLLGPAVAGLAGGVWGLGIALFSFALGNSQIETSIVSLVVLGLVPSGYACAGSILTRRFGFNPLILGFGWLLADWALSAAGVKSGLLSAAQHDSYFMSLMGQSVGYLVIAYLVALVNAAIFAAITEVRLPFATFVPLRRAARDVGDVIWHFAPSLRSFRLLCPHQARAPPHLAP